MAKLGVYIAKNYHLLLKLTAAKRGQYIGDLLEEIIADWMARNYIEGADERWRRNP